MTGQRRDQDGARPAEASQQLELQRRHDQLQAARERTVPELHAAARRQLEEASGRLAEWVQRSGPAADRGRDLAAVQRLRANQAALLDEARRLDLDVLRLHQRTLEQIAPHQRREFERVADEQLRGLEGLRDRLNVQLREDRRALAELLEGQRGPDHRARLAETLHHAAAARASLQLDLREARSGAGPQLEAVARHVDAELAGGLRGRLATQLGTAPLSEDALRRVVDAAALRAGWSALDDQARAAKEAGAVGRVKGRLAEELLAPVAAAEAAAVNQGRPASRQLEFIAGHRIRTEGGKEELSDGLLAWRDNSGAWRPGRGYEVKAGAASAQELDHIIRRLTSADEEELRRYARDLARERLAEDRSVQGSLAKLTEQYEQELRSWWVQLEAGQLRHTMERLDLAERFRIDGQVQGRRADGRVEAVGVVPHDVLPHRRDLVRLPVTAEQLERAARAVVDLLLHYDR